MESRFSLWLKSFCAGATALMAVTSLCSLLAAVRWLQPVEPYVWIENPLGSSLAAPVVWHLALAAEFAAATFFLLRPLLPSGTRRHVVGLRRPVVHFVVAIALAALCLLALMDAVVFYWLLARGQIASAFPVPLSLFLFVLLFVVDTLVWDIPLPACRPPWLSGLLGLAGFGAGVVGLVLLHLVTFGTTDYSRRADVAIVMGARVYSDGVPSLALADRLQTAIELYEAGRVQFLLMTGGTGSEGINEARAMRDFAADEGVPAERIVIDEHGVNTLASARNCRRILDERGLTTALVVSHYYHLARCKMLFAEHGIACATVPARMSRRLVKEPYYVFRECIAYLAYTVQRPLRPSVECARADSRRRPVRPHHLIGE